jgi:hypothetical protein
MAERLKHTDVQKMMGGLAEASIINLDVPVRSLVESARTALPDSSEELSLHILCCNEYFLVTALTDTPLEQVRAVASEVRDSLG